MIRLVECVDDEGVATARGLFRDYAEEFAPWIAGTLAVQGFDAEVADLPGRYAPPSGGLILAYEGDVPAGCVGLRDLGGGTSEMKRLYVAPGSRNRGAGRRLVEAVIALAGRLGHRRMVLDTMPEMVEAIALYRRCGFFDAEAYWGHPLGHAVFMERAIGDEG